MPYDYRNEQRRREGQHAIEQERARGKRSNSKDNGRELGLTDLIIGLVILAFAFLALATCRGG